MAKTILMLLLSLSFSGSLVILLTCFLLFLFQKKLNFHWQYYIWIAAAARLLLPFAPPDNLAEAFMTRIQNAVQNTQIQADNSQTAPLHTTDRTAERSSFQDGTDTAGNFGSTNSSSSLGSNNSLKYAGLIQIFRNTKRYLCIFWLMTAALLFLRKVTVYQDFVRFIRSGSTPVDDIGCLETLSGLETRLGIHKPVELWECPFISSPLFMGFLHPCIVLPAGSLPKKQFYYTVLHELIHDKRKDMYYKWTVQCIQCIHWFNPLVHVMVHRINRLCELSCDEAAADFLKNDISRREYAATLLAAMAAEGGFKEPPASLTLNGNKQLLKERLESIMKQREKATLSRKILSAVLAGTIAITSFFSGSCFTSASGQSPQTEINTASISHTRSKKDPITSAQADEMALALTNKIWVWDWVAFFVPYMSDDGIEQLLPASKHSEWAGSTDMTTGKKLKFTKKQIQSARKSEPEQALTRKDIDSHALLIMESNGDWNCISFMLPYMSRKGIRAVVRCYNQKHGGKKKRAEDYF